jgi:antitoxin component of MazEF toxin-antitoxin module
MARITRWGNSVGGLRLPKAIIEGAGLRVGDEVNCRLLDNGTILLTPLRSIAEVQTHMTAATRQAFACTELKW